MLIDLLRLSLHNNFRIMFRHILELMVIGYRLYRLKTLSSESNTMLTIF